MNKPLFAAAAFVGTIAMATPALVQAQVYQPPVYQPPVNQPVYQRAPYGAARYRERDLRWVAGHVGTAVITLERTGRGYGGGDRGAALNLLRDAHRELRMAVAFAAQNGYQVVNLGAERTRQYPGMRNARMAGDRAVRNAQIHVPIWIDMLQRDNRDFGGHRMAAIRLLQQAEGALNAALQRGE